ncbi:efflux RND transporter permease subunit [candidate division KSB1 bacterium]
MNFSEIFIRRPVATTLIMLAILIFGVAGYRQLPVSDLPNVDFPTLSVSASLPGASPETMASAVATPLEKQFSTIAGITSMTSTSSQGGTSITIQFDLKRDLDAAAQDVQSAISRVQRQLPQDMPTPPSYRKVNPADSPILFIALTSPTLPLSTLDEYGQTLMAQRMSMVNGVAQVMVYGSQKYAVRINLDPKVLAARGIGINEVAGAIRNANVNLPTGILYGQYRAFTVQADGQLNRAEGYGDIIVSYRDGKPVRLRDLGEAIDSVENDKSAAWYINDRSVILAVQRQPGTNTVAVARGVRELLPSFAGQLPPSVSMHILFDRSESIQASVRDVKFTLLLTLCLVILVIFLFLRNLSATVIPSMALPMSLIGTFSIMYLLGYSLDNLSLMALTLSVGFVVDDAIVMLENIVRHMEMGKPPLKAALEGSREVGFTIISMTLSLTAVFIPVLLMGGIMGRLFQEFAVTIAVAILISGFVSLTLTPMMSSRFLKPSSETKHGRVYQASERVFTGMLRYYQKGLRWSLTHRRFTMLYSALILVGMAYLFVRAPKGFLPSEDTGRITARTLAAQGISFDDMVRHQRAAAEVIRQDPSVESFMSSAGSRGSRGGNSGFMTIRLKPRSERKLHVDEIIAGLRPKLAALPGIITILQNPPPIRIGGRMSRSQYQFTLQGADMDELYRYGQEFESLMNEMPSLEDVTSDLEITNPQVNVKIDRDKAASYGVTPEQIESALYSAYGDRRVSTIYAPQNTYRVIMKLEPRYQSDPELLSLLYVRSGTGRLVPLNAVAALDQSVGPLSINHSGQLPSVTISFNLKPGVSLGQAINEIERRATGTLPGTISTNFQGTAEAFQSSLRGMGLLLLLAVLVIYMVLGILYESFIHPLTILSALPFAGFGALVTLMVFGVDLNLYSFVGLVMLVGLVKKNGIMMIDFALEAQREEGKDAVSAIFQACVIRFRPIMMTTMSALMGTLPIAVGIGAGAESRQPLGLAVVGGLLFSQFLTLFVTPVFFLYMDSFQGWLLRTKGRKQKSEIAGTV